MPETILIVDDAVSTVRMLLNLLAEQGLSGFSASTGEDALRTAEREQIDLVLLSTHLPDASGYDLIAPLREAVARGNAQTVPVIFISDMEAVGDKIKAFRSGGVDFITKPLQVAETLARVNTHLTTRRLTRALLDAKTELEHRVEERNSKLNEQLRLFKKFVPQTFARTLDESGFDVTRGVSREEFYTVLSCDIRNFTTFSESITCTECFRFLNSYFTVMEPGIRGHGGFIYQYVGDSIMALFPPDADGKVDGALRSAIDLHQDVLREYNHGRAKAGYQPIRIGTGLNSGSVAIGIAGTPERMEASAFGSTVNIAARCEELTKETGADTILTHHTYERLAHPDRFAIHTMGQTRIRGMNQTVELYEATGYA